MAGQELYFFTQLKKVSWGSRFNGKIAYDAWQGKDGAKPVLARRSEIHVDSFKVFGG